MTDPYKTAFNVQNGIAIEKDGVDAMATELQKLKEDYNDLVKDIESTKESAEMTIPIIQFDGINKESTDEKAYSIGFISGMEAILESLNEL